MKRILCPQLPKPGTDVTLDENEAKHAIQVLRLRDGDSVEALDGKGHSGIAVLRTKGGPPRLQFASDGPSPISPHAEKGTDVLPIVLELAVLKGPAMEWAIEKAVELGVRELIPILTAHTVVQTGRKGPEAFRERWQKIADQALKQCGRLQRMTISTPMSLERAIQSSRERTGQPQPDRAGDLRLWCDEQLSPPPVFITKALAESAKTGTFRILIGPEGGWSSAERALLSAESHCKQVNLGPLVLRAETAAIFACSAAVLHLRSLT